MPGSIRATAEQVLAIVRRNHDLPYDAVPVMEEDFPHLEFAAYARFRSTLRDKGFSDLGDVEVPGFTAGGTRSTTMIRGMLSNDGHVKASYHQTKPMLGQCARNLLQGLLHLRFIDAPLHFIRMMKTLHSVDFGTEFSDGRHLCTVSAAYGSTVPVPPSIESRCFPAGTPVLDLLSWHLARIKEICEANQGVRPLSMASMEDALDMMRRQKALKDSHRVAIGWITRQELIGISRGNERLADAVFLELQKILEEERGNTAAR